MRLIDSHCHLDALDYVHEHRGVDDVLKKAQHADVRFVIAIATTLAGYEALVAQVGLRSDVAFSCGEHPLELVKDAVLDKERLLRCAQAAHVVGIGETGLDYYYQQDNKLQQQQSFRQHIQVARAVHKPVIVHTRNAAEDTLHILQDEDVSQCGGVLHCFTEDRQMATALLDLGMYLSFSGIVTFRQAEGLREVLRWLPLERLLIETDAPYLAPAPYRGKPNQPAYLRALAEYIASLRGLKLHELAEITAENTVRLFKLTI